MSGIKERDHYTCDGWRIQGRLYGRGTGRTRAIDTLMTKGLSMADANAYLNMLVLDYSNDLQARDDAWRNA